MNSSDGNPSLITRLGKLFARLRFMSFSLLLHVVIIIVGGGAVLFRQYVEPPDFVADGGSLIDTGAPANAPPEEPPKLEEMQIQPPKADLATPSISAITSVTSSASYSMNAMAAPNMTGKSLASLAKKAEDLGKGMAAAGGSMAKGGTAMRFFGVQARADSVVFVVDVSGSMVTGSKSVKSYEVLEKEVGKVIRELSDKNMFGIVVFSRDAEPFKPQLIRATRDDKERAFNWLKSKSPEAYINPRSSDEEKAYHRGTRADLGLKRAFELQPDAIFFVSDGEPTGTTAAQVLKQVEAAQVNRPRKASIHTIAYLADSGQQFMRDLAQKNEGNFREVNPKDVR